jgi:hypothetical protein
MSFLLRWVFAFLLVALTYNPTDFNYIRWAADNFGAQTPLALLLGLVLLIGWVIYFTATWRGIGLFGVLLILAVLGTLTWFLAQQGILSLDNPGLVTWLAVVAISVVLGIGMTWGILWRRISGQLEVDDTAG